MVDGALVALCEPQPRPEDYRAAAREVLAVCAEMRRAEYQITWQEAADRAARRQR